MCCSQGLRLSYHMVEANTKAAALRNSALQAGMQQDAALISQLREAVEELTGTAAQQAAIIAAQAATTECPSAVNNYSVQVCCCLLLLLSCNDHDFLLQPMSDNAVGIKILLAGLALVR